LSAIEVLRIRDDSDWRFPRTRDADDRYRGAQLSHWLREFARRDSVPPPRASYHGVAGRRCPGCRLHPAGGSTVSAVWTNRATAGVCARSRFHCRC